MKVADDDDDDVINDVGSIERFCRISTRHFDSQYRTLYSLSKYRSFIRLMVQAYFATWFRSYIYDAWFLWLLPLMIIMRVSGRWCAHVGPALCPQPASWWIASFASNDVYLRALLCNVMRLARVISVNAVALQKFLYRFQMGPVHYELSLQFWHFNCLFVYLFVCVRLFAAYLLSSPRWKCFHAC